MSLGDVFGVIPHTDDTMALASGGTFVFRYSYRPPSERIGEVVEQIQV